MSGSLARLFLLIRAHRSISVLVGWALVGALLPVVVLIPPLSTFQSQGLWIGGFANSGVFILLALGLNIVVGLAGLLDLGYAAFFAIGSYTYAFGASSFTGLHVPFWPMLLVGAFAAATFGAPRRCACAATTWPSSPWASGRSCPPSSSTPTRTHAARTASVASPSQPCRS